MEPIYQQLADHLLESLKSLNVGQKLLIGLAGSPGSGKTTTSLQVCRRLNEAAGQEVCVVVPMDGFHLYKSQLKEMANSEEAFARRGAHWTFDPKALAKLLATIKSTGEAKAPSFDHGVGDPVENDIKILQSHSIVIVEGNYLYLDLPEWREVSNLLDDRWFVEVDEDIAMERVVKRHMGTGNDERLARFRVENNDRLNAKQVNETSHRASRIIRSIEE